MRVQSFLLNKQTAKGRSHPFMSFEPFYFAKILERVLDFVGRMSYTIYKCGLPHSVCPCKPRRA